MVTLFSLQIVARSMNLLEQFLSDWITCFGDITGSQDTARQMMRLDRDSFGKAICFGSVQRRKKLARTIDARTSVLVEYASDRF
ncbi:hypothetical protein [Rhodopirellula sp. SWK7]|uniref:hypothetical protein n=1 Tax=Rhodopirellula sp. SWK7 TaxID=595460 RepID=UPI00034AE9A1|nr:hypothetical protein [Rhodopirellula sp. SWK7]